MMAEGNSICKYLDWDSNFFGRRIASITLSRLNKDVIEQVMIWCNLHDIDCLYFLSDPNDAVTIRLAEESRFRLVDIRVTLEKQIDYFSIKRDRGFEGLFHQCTPEDIQALRAIAQVSHRDTRFYYDPNFPEYLCSAFYETWIEKSCNGYADAVLVAEVQGRPVGYISCHIIDHDHGHIGLVGISAEFQGKHLGIQLINESLRWFTKQGQKKVTVVTQGRNLKAQRVFQSCGFLTSEVQLWYHRWFLAREPK